MSRAPSPKWWPGGPAPTGRGLRQGAVDFVRGHPCRRPRATPPGGSIGSTRGSCLWVRPAIPNPAPRVALRSGSSALRWAEHGSPRGRAYLPLATRVGIDPTGWKAVARKRRVPCARAQVYAPGHSSASRRNRCPLAAIADDFDGCVGMAARAGAWNVTRRLFATMFLTGLYALLYWLHDPASH